MTNPIVYPINLGGSFVSWLYGSWIYNYVFNQYLSLQSCEFESSPWRGVREEYTGFSAGIPMAYACKTGRQDIDESGVKHHSSNTNPNLLI